MAAVAIGVTGAAAGYNLAQTAEPETPELIAYDDEGTGQRMATDQNGELWVPISIPQGGTIYAELGGNREAISQTLRANGIENPADIRPEQPVWVPAEALPAEEE